MKKFTMLFAVLGIVGIFAAPVSYAQNDLFDEVCEQAGSEAGQSPACQDTTGDDPLTGEGGLIVRIINFVSVIGGIIAVVIIMYGGFQYITSGGDPGKTTGARNTILYAVIGLLVIALAQAAVSFILTRVL